MTLNSFFSNNIGEIRESVVLRVYGILLCLIHPLSWYFWFASTGSYKLLMADPLAICWPFFQSCGVYRNLSIETWDLVAVVWLVLAGVTGLMFLSKRTVTWAYWCFLLLNALKLMLFVGEYRVMGNYHYMPFFVSFVFLFLNSKKPAILYMIACFYISAGLLKLDTEWLLGAAFTNVSAVQGEALEWMLAYVVLFETLGALLLLCNNVWIFLFLFFQYIFFHAYSWHIVGYFYPLNMFCLLSAFLLFRFVPKGGFLKFVPREPITVATKYFLGVFLFINVVPRIIFPDLALTGKGRMFALNMLDARVHCHHFSYIVKEKEVVEVSSKRRDLALRIKCDPLIFFEEASEICQSLEEGERLATYLVARKRTQKEWLKVFSYEDFCGENIHMNWYGDFP